MRRILDHNPETGVSHVWHWDNATEQSTITAEQDVTPLLDANRAQSNEQGKEFAKSGLTKVASIPMSIYMDLAKRGVLNDQKAMKRWLNDPDNRAFRTHEAHV